MRNRGQGARVTRMEKMGRRSLIASNRKRLSWRKLQAVYDTTEHIKTKPVILNKEKVLMGNNPLVIGGKKIMTKAVVKKLIYCGVLP